MPTDDLSNEIARLGREFSLRTMAGLEVVERARQQLGAPHEQDEMNAALGNIRAIAHRLAGSGTVFGYPEVSETAALLEIFVDAIMKGETMMLEAEVERLDELITALRGACSSAVYPGNDLP